MSSGVDCKSSFMNIDNFRIVLHFVVIALLEQIFFVKCKKRENDQREKENIHRLMAESFNWFER